MSDGAGTIAKARRTVGIVGPLLNAGVGGLGCNKYNETESSIVSSNASN